MRHKLPKSARLRSETDFAQVLGDAHGRNGRVVKRGLYIFYVAGDGPAQLGITIAKKILKRAVDRNRVKRVIRDWYRQNRERLCGKILVRLAKAPLSGDSSLLLVDLEALASWFEEPARLAS